MVADTPEEFLQDLYGETQNEVRPTSWDTSKKCRFCKRDVAREDAAVYVGYFWKNRFVSHKSCLKDGSREEAQQCRELDGNCNDCTHFRGTRFVGSGASRKRCGTCVRKLQPSEVKGEYGFTWVPEPSLEEFSVWTGDPMFMPCFELRGK